MKNLCLFLPVLTILACANSAHAQEAAWKPVASGPLTRWAAQVSPANALPEYPRPQMVRRNWQNLNGLWDYAVADAATATAPANYDGKILVPFPIEAPLSGVAKTFAPDQKLFYRRSFTIPAAWKNRRVLLHFGAVDYESSFELNGKILGQHRGGYDPFTFDITDDLKTGAQELKVAVTDPSDKGEQPIGKQKLDPTFIWYTPTSGIWQTVWLEAVPQNYIENLKLTPDLDAGVLRIRADVAGAGLTLRATTPSGATVVGAADGELKLPVPRARLWTPDDPFLYDLKVELLRNGAVVDGVGSYFAMRSVSVGRDKNGIARPLLNGHFVFQTGVLDQGYWPDGVYTAPTDAALIYDIETAKKLGFNLIRKHLKVEPQRWYYHADRIGMLVWQDMPAANTRTPDSRAEFRREMAAMIENLSNHPCIVMWVPFNEGGDFESQSVVEQIRALDPTRLVSNASGWNDKGFGDVIDVHTYPRPRSPLPDDKRFAAVGEFGGLSMKVPGHQWNSAKTWGYQELPSAQAFANRYAELMAVARDLEADPGLSAVVYTQISDVEIENTGLMTYDRAIIKPDVALMQQANRGEFPNVKRYQAVVAASDIRAQTWKYTTEKPAANWFEPTFNDAAWKSGPGGFGGGGLTDWPKAEGAQVADIWLRRVAKVRGPLPEKLMIFASHDEDFELYINGVLAGSATGFTGDYVTLPINEAGRAALKVGDNLIAVHCHDSGGGRFIDVGIVVAP